MPGCGPGASGRATYAVAGFHRQWWRVFSPSSIAHAIQLKRHGYKQDGLKGDAMQLGGAVVVARGGRVVYTHAESSIGDHAKAEELTKALMRAY